MGIEISTITAQEMRDLAISGGVNVPIEQTWVWAEFEETFPHRKLLAFVKVVANGEPVAILSLVKDKFRGFDFLWAKHGPVWLVPENERLEHEAVDALVRWVKKRDPKIAFIRLHLRYPRKRDESPLGTAVFEEGVILDVENDANAYWNALRPEGRENLDRSLAADELEIRNITGEALEYLGGLGDVLEGEDDIKARDFPTLSEEDQRNLLATLGQEHSQVYLASRKEGEVDKPLAWVVFTIGGTEAVYYLSAIVEGTEKYAPLSRVIHQASKDFRAKGIRTIDMVGIGPDLLPVGADEDEDVELGLRFAQTLTNVRPAYDVPVSRVLFALVEQTELPHKAVATIKRKLKRSEKND